MLQRFRSRVGCAAIIWLSCSAVWADVTLRYKTEVTMNPTLPPQLAQMAVKEMEASVPSESSLLFKLCNASALRRYRSHALAEFIG
jgi:hypothetical protein